MNHVLVIHSQIVVAGTTFRSKKVRAAKDIQGLSFAVTDQLRLEMSSMTQTIMAAPTEIHIKRAPVFVTIDTLRPETSGHNVKVKVCC